jgi:CubicO group peptidase (beta-lactamase class C family)
MSRSGYHWRRETDAHNAQALVRSGEGWAVATGSEGGRGTAAGGAYTTAAEMLKFSRALVQSRIVLAETLKRITSHQPGREASALQYGYGFELHTQGGVRSFGHGGQATGANFEFRYFPDQDLTLVILSNQDNGAFDDLRKNTIKLVTGVR